MSILTGSGAASGITGLSVDRISKPIIADTWEAVNQIWKCRLTQLPHTMLHTPPSQANVAHRSSRGLASCFLSMAHIAGRDDLFLYSVFC